MGFYMLITRKHPLGGKPLKKGYFTLHSDRNGNFGYLIGYVPEESFTGDKIIISLSDAEEFTKAMCSTWQTFYDRNLPKERVSEKIKRWTIHRLGGEIVENKGI